MAHDLTFGVFIPQGWKMELSSIDGAEAKWQTAVDVARLIEELGYGCAGVQTAMLFVRSLKGGVSHSPEEDSSPEDVELAVDVLAGALARLT